MRIGKQIAGRDITNYELAHSVTDPDLRRQLMEIEFLVRRAIDSGAVEEHRAADLDSAAQEVIAAAAHPERGSSRLVRAVQALKHLATAASSTAGIAAAADGIFRSMTGS